MKTGLYRKSNEPVEHRIPEHIHHPAFLFEPIMRLPSPYINHFISADTIVPGYTNPQNLNRYSYVINNPLRYTDPTGHMADYGGNEGGGGCNSITCFPQAPSNSSNGGGGGSGGGSHDDDDETDVSQQLQYCLQHPFASQCAIPSEDSLMPIQPNYDFIAPWEFNRLDAWGFRFNGTGCLIIICGDISLDLIGNLITNEGTLFLTPGVHFGLGYGVDGSVGIVGAYDAPSNSVLAGASQNFSINITPGTGGQGSYSVSESPNFTGNYAQTYSLSVSAGGEASAVFGPSYSFPIGTCTSTTCYWGVR